MEQKQVYSHSRQGFIKEPYLWTRPGERWERIGDTLYYCSNYGRILRKVYRRITVKKKKKRKPFTRRKPGWKRRFNYHKTHRYYFRLVHPTEKIAGKQLEMKHPGKKTQSAYVHRLVADLFQLCDPGEKVLFRDGSVWNPILTNLKVRGTNQGKLSQRQKRFCKELFEKYPSNVIIPELAARFCVGHTTIWRVYKDWEYDRIYDLSKPVSDS